ncbi:isopentenyltransferase 9 [Artemisia annua]|uniref:tRNA dimethylallyltransferase n=1 Tax=Artemisia annua TaxID=35608 RepID=A0A2U1QAG8_ARTAN|nr:isopentenyltransferase 9 [Artemisia annua]
MNTVIGRFITTSLRPPPETSFLRTTALKHRRIRLFTTVNCSASNKQKVIVISGPTGAGKSRLALELAKKLNGEIISADSVQHFELERLNKIQKVYQGLDVGSAKPSISERQVYSVIAYDKCCDLCFSPQANQLFQPDYSAGNFYDDGRQATKDILNRGRVPIVTGGTGLYLRWFIYGKPDVPKATPEISLEVQSELATFERRYDWDAAVELVTKAGDSSAQSLPANDWYRLRRKLEIIKSSGLPPSAFPIPYDSFKGQVDSHSTDLGVATPTDVLLDEKQKDLDYDFICFFLSTSRTDLYRSIDFRCEDMVSGDKGILSEARWLLDMGLLPNSNSATRAIGYRQNTPNPIISWDVLIVAPLIIIACSIKAITELVIPRIETKINRFSYEQAMEYLLNCEAQGGRSSTRDFYAFLSEFQKASRNFAKRQLTWFRNEPIYNWIDASRPLEEVIDFLYKAYHDQTGKLVLPRSLAMEKDMSDRRQIAQLKTYRTKREVFISQEDCSDILDWIKSQNPNQESSKPVQDNDNPDQELEKEEEGECPFCAYMKGGECREQFINWEKCIEEGENNGEDIVEKCVEVTTALKKCMEANQDYYAPILQAEKMAEQQALNQLEQEKAKEAENAKEANKAGEEEEKVKEETTKKISWWSNPHVMMRSVKTCNDEKCEDDNEKSEDDHVKCDNDHEKFFWELYENHKSSSELLYDETLESDDSVSEDEDCGFENGGSGIEDKKTSLFLEKLENHTTFIKQLNTESSQSDNSVSEDGDWEGHISVSSRGLTSCKSVTALGCASSNDSTRLASSS